MVNEVKRIYSNDEVLWANMSRKDIGKDSYKKECFDKANTNGDDKIDLEELKAYNKNISLYLWDEDGEKTDSAKCVFPGTTREEAYGDETKKKMFDKVNTDNDDELSYEEVNTYALKCIKERELYKYNVKRNNRQQEKREKAANIGAAIFGIAGLLASGLICGKILSDVRNVLLWKSAWGGIAAGAIGGAYVGNKIGSAIGKLLFKDDKNWKESFDKEYEAPKHAPKDDYPFEDGEGNIRSFSIMDIKEMQS